MKRRVDNQHLLIWRGPCSTQRQARKLILGPSPTTKTRFLSYNRTQFRVVIGLLTGHNTVRRHLHLVPVTNGPVCRRCTAEEETAALDLCSVRLGSGRRICLSPFFLGSVDIKDLRLGAIWNFSKGTGLPSPNIRLWDTKGLF